MAGYLDMFYGASYQHLFRNAGENKQRQEVPAKAIMPI